MTMQGRALAGSVPWGWGRAVTSLAPCKGFPAEKLGGGVPEPVGVCGRLGSATAQGW